MEASQTVLRQPHQREERKLGFRLAVAEVAVAVAAAAAAAVVGVVVRALARARYALAAC
jgi:hypothetical protein